MKRNQNYGYVGIWVSYMKKVKILILVIIISFISACSFNNMKSNYIDNLSEKIIKCFDERDCEALKELFCDEIKINSELESEITDAFDKYNGISISYNVTDKDLSESSMRDGKYVMKRYVPLINDIVTDEKNEYVIGFNTYEICEFKPSKEGVTILVLSDGEGNQLAVIGGIN